jgi:hypothetical protein
LQRIGRRPYVWACTATASLRLLPGFMLIGAQRCGTTSLFHALSAHPQVARPRFHKGVNYFDLNYYRGVNWYRGHFPMAESAQRRAARYGAPVAFEASGYYLYHPFAMERLARELPAVKLVVMVRDPVERAFSAYKHEYARGFERESFEKALESEESRLAGEISRMRDDPRYESFAHRHHSYKRRGHYAEQLERVFKYFPREQVHVIDSEAYFAEPGQEYRNLLAFLGLRPFGPVTFLRHNARPGPPMEPKTEQMLKRYYAPRDERLAALLGRPLRWAYEGTMPLTADDTTACQTHLVAHTRSPEERQKTESGASIPKTIWFFWSQGLQNAPCVVRKCHETWIARNPGWRVVCLDATTMQDFASVDYSSSNISSLSLQHRAGLFRLDLLAHHGGVWADATCFCMQPLDDWLPPKMESGFFAFRRPAPDRVISSWFLAAEENNILASRLFDRMLAYWGGHAFYSDERKLLVKTLSRLLKHSPRTRALWFSRMVRDWLAIGPYFGISYGFEKLLREDPECAHIWERTPTVSAGPPHHLYNVGLLSPVSPAIRSEIDRREVPVYKTTWRFEGQTIPSGSILEYLFEMVRA